MTMSPKESSKYGLFLFPIYIDFNLAAARKEKENTKRKHIIITVVGA